MDFKHDVLADGTKIRVLTIVDIFSRERVALEVDCSFKAPQVVDVLRRVSAERGKAQRVRCDNGPEFVSLHLDQWAHRNGVQRDFSRPGKPSDNGFCESFNNRVRQELLNPTWLRSLDDARQHAAAWRHDYNTNRPPVHSTICRPKSSRGDRKINLLSPLFLESPRDKNWGTTLSAGFSTYDWGTFMRQRHT
jgi:putative transposase